MAKQTIHIQCRLHPDNEFEDIALKYYQEQLDNNYSPRQIITDALCKAAGYSPEMFPEKHGRLTTGMMENLLADFGHELLRQLRHNMPAVSTPHGQVTDESPTDADMEYAKNLAAGYMTRRNRKGKS